MTNYSVETKYVGAMIALKATQALSHNLAAYLAGVARVDGSPSEEGEECVRRLLDQMMHEHLDVSVTDQRPGSFDAEGAREFAWDTLKVHEAFVRERLLL